MLPSQCAPNVEGYRSGPHQNDDRQRHGDARPDVQGQERDGERDQHAPLVDEMEVSLWSVR